MLIQDRSHSHAAVMRKVIKSNNFWWHIFDFRKSNGCCIEFKIVKSQYLWAVWFLVFSSLITLFLSLITQKWWDSWREACLDLFLSFGSIT